MKHPLPLALYAVKDFKKGNKNSNYNRDKNRELLKKLFKICGGFDLSNRKLDMVNDSRFAFIANDNKDAILVLMGEPTTDATK